MMDAFLNLHSLLKYDAGTPKTMMHALLNLHALLKSMMHSLITFMIIQSKVRCCSHITSVINLSLIHI